MKKKILFLTPQLPYPPISGGTIKSWKLVRYLSKNYKLSVGTLLKNDDDWNVDEFSSKVNLENIYCEKINIPRDIKNLMKSYINNIPLTIYRNYSGKFKNKIREVIYRYNIIIVDHYVMYQYIPDNYKGSVILHEHNAEYVMWERAARLEKNIFRKKMLYLEAKRIKKYEEKICNYCSSILAAPNDIVALQRLGISADKFHETLHLGDEKLLSLPRPEFQNTTKSLLYIGNLTWEANIDGLLWFIENMWDTLKDRNPDLVFYIVGRNPDERLKKIIGNRKDIYLAGFIENLEDYYSKARIFVCPLRFGSGIKVKVVNAMYRGIPVVTTSIGAEGLMVKDMYHMAISDDNAKMINDIDILLSNREKWELLRDNSRELAIREYTWDKVFTNIERAIDAIKS